MKSCYQKSTGTYVGLDEDSADEEETPKPSSTSAAIPRPTPIQALLPKSSQNIHRQVLDVVGSTVPVPYRFLKLKIELLNIVAILPKGLLTWCTPAAATAAAAVAEKKKKDTNDGDDESDSGDGDGDENLATDEENKNDASVSVSNETEMTVEKFIEEIQKCDTYGNFFKLIQLLERALPLVALFDYPFHSSLDFTHASLTSSMVATYLYSLDRWIRYEDIPLDFYYEGVNYRPRLVYTPRCALSPTCLKYFHHHGRCDPAISIGDSRFREIVPKGMQPVPNQSAKQLLTNQFQKSLPPLGMMSNLQQKYPSQSNNLQYGSRPNYASPNMPMMMRPDPGVFTIDSIQPYVPKKEELKDSAWV
jgi:hypothetical protein